MSTEVVVQMGHCFRTRGFTGTSGWGHTEQEFVTLVGRMMVAHLNDAGVRALTATADQSSYPDCEVFVALHQDGADDRTARGASVGYPSSWLTHPKPLRVESARAAQIWKAYYQGQAGWTAGFRGDNYSAGLRRFYMWRHGKINARAKFLIEHGFATNEADQTFMWSNLETIARTNADALLHYLGVPSAPDLTEGDDMLKLFHSTHSVHGGWWLVDSGVGLADHLEKHETWLAKADDPNDPTVGLIEDKWAHVIVDKFYAIV